MDSARLGPRVVDHVLELVPRDLAWACKDCCCYVCVLPPIETRFQPIRVWGHSSQWANRLGLQRGFTISLTCPALAYFSIEANICVFHCLLHAWACKDD